MRRILTLALTLLFALSLLPASFACAEEPENKDAPALRTAIGMTANIVANAIEGTFEGKQSQWGERLAKTPFGTPLKAVVARLTNDQLAVMCERAGVEDSSLARTLAMRANTEFSTEYAAVADAIAYEDVFRGNDDAEGCILTLLVYEWDLSMTISIPKKGVWSAMLMGMPSLAGDIDGAYVEAYAKSLGLTNVVYTICDLPVEAAATENTLSVWNDRLNRAVTLSEETMRRMLPGLCESGWSAR